MSNEMKTAGEPVVTASNATTTVAAGKKPSPNAGRGNLVRLKSVPRAKLGTVAAPSYPEAGFRADLTTRIAADIADVALVLAQLRHQDLTPPVVQMVQQRIHDLAIGICQVVDCPAGDLSEIKGQLYPSELDDGSAL